MPFLLLLRDNRNVRRLWLGQVVSQLGDWFNAVALYALLLELTGTATSVAAMMVVQFLPSAIVGPYAGVIVDRHDRRRVLVTTDIVRGIVVLGLLLVTSRDTIWLAYVVMAVAVVAQAFFEPARAAILPDVASREELLTANALSSATWSAMLAIGAGLGGLLTAAIGRNAAFVANSISFFASAWCILGIVSDDTRPKESRSRESTGFLEGLRFIRDDARVAAFVSIKGVWGVAGGALLLMTIFGERVFPTGGGAVTGIGVLFAARGIGAGIGSLLTARLARQAEQLTRVLAPSYATLGLAYVALGMSPALWAASLAVVVAHAGGSILWVASTVLLQLAVPDRFRGRVFAIEYAMLTLMSSAASFACGRAVDALHANPRHLAMLIGAWFVVPAIWWWRRPVSPGASARPA